MKFRNLLNTVAAVALVAVIAASASAVPLQLGLVYEGSLLADGATPTTYSLADGVPNAPGEVLPDDIHMFGVQLTLLNAVGEGTAAEESLQVVILDAVLGPGLTPYGPATYLAGTNPSFDPPGLPTARNLWSTNEDSGVQDLLRIVGITDNLAAHGLDPGEGGPYALGTILFNWDTSVAPATSLYLAPAAETSDPWAVWIGMEGIAQLASTMFRSDNPGGPSADFDLGGGETPIIPEPASIVMAGLAMIGCLGMFRRRS